MPWQVSLGDGFVLDLMGCSLSEVEDEATRIKEGSVSLASKTLIDAYIHGVSCPGELAIILKLKKMFVFEYVGSVHMSKRPGERNQVM